MPESPDESVESIDTSNDQSTSQEDEDGSIVDMLLADVRSGFTSRKFKDGNFSVQKVTKVNLMDAISTGTGIASDGVENNDGATGGSFVRNGYGRRSHRKRLTSNDSVSPTEAGSPTPDSLNQKRNRRSYATEDNESLIDFLMEADNPASSEAQKPETAFERYGSLRRRRQERKDKRGILESFDSGRERAASPSITEGSFASNADVQMRTTGANQLSVERPKSGTSSDPTGPGNRALRRTRSWLDRPSMDKANHDLKSESTDESDALLDRIKQRLSKKVDGRSSRTDEHLRLDKTDSSDSNSSFDDDSSSSRNYNRWRSGISAPESPLETITEKSPDVAMAKLANSSEADTVVMRRSASSRGRLSNRYSSNLDPAEISRMVSNQQEMSQQQYSRDDSDMHTPSVAVSVRKQISSGMGTNIDHVLKTIEDTGRQIDTVGVSGPIKRSPAPEVVTESKAPSVPQGPQVAVVAHMTASTRPITPIGEVDLKAKRDKRKKRSTLSMEDVRAAMRQDVKDANEVTNVAENQDDFNSQQSFNNEDQSQNNKPVAKTPPTSRQPESNKEISSETMQNAVTNNKELSKAAKLAAKKRFKDARFGDSGSSDAKDRAKSNVETDSVDQALKEMANQGSMSRSKSYDEHVAKNGDVEFNSNAMCKGNGGSAPDTAGEKRSVKRNSNSRLSMDGRRNGLYIPSDESDTELTPDDLGSRRPSSAKSDSPKSISRLSLRSTNTSTETLQADIESSPEQRRKSTDSISQSRTGTSRPFSSQLTDSSPMTYSQVGSTNTGTVSPLPPRPNSTTPVEMEDSYFRRTYSMMERTRLHTDEEDNDNPLAKMAKWRMNRSRQRRSVYDNVMENDLVSTTQSSQTNQTNQPPASNNRSYLSPTTALFPDVLQQAKEITDLKNEVGSRSSYASSYASSNERDEGFETGSGSGSASQRTSMSSTIDSDIYATPILSRRVDNSRPKAPAESSNDKVPSNDSVMTRLSIEAERKERTESWTEQTVRESEINNDQASDISQEFSTLSPDSGHSTSKEDIWSEEQSEIAASSAASKKDSTSSTSTTKSSKTKLVPSYMKPTNSSSSKPAQTKNSSPTKTQTPKISVPSKHDTPNRISYKEKEQPAVFKRDTSVRASMRAESASSGFHRGTTSRTSIRGPRSAVKLTPGASKTAPESIPKSGTLSRARADSNTSISSLTSNSSNTNASTASLTKKRLAPTSSTGSTSKRPTTPSANRPTTPLSRPTTPSVKSAPAPQPTTRGGSNFTRTQSMRVTTRSSIGSESSDAPSKAVSKKSTSSLSNSTQSLSRSVTPQPQDRSRSTTPLPERPHSTTPFSKEERASTRRSSFMAPTAASKAKKDIESTTPVAPARTKSLSQKSTPLVRHASLRMPKKQPTSPTSPKELNGGRKSPSSFDSPLMHKQEHHQSLSTVTELVADEDKEAKNMESNKKSPSILKRIGIVKTKSLPPASSTTAKSPIKKK